MLISLLGRRIFSLKHSASFPVRNLAIRKFYPRNRHMKRSSDCVAASEEEPKAKDNRKGTGPPEVKRPRPAEKKRRFALLIGYVGTKYLNQSHKPSLLRLPSAARPPPLSAATMECSRR